MESWLRCTVTPGQFTGEYAVRGEQFNGSVFSFFAPEEYVAQAEAVENGRHADAWVRVHVWGQKGNLAVVRLPRESFESGQYVTVPTDQLTTTPRPLVVS